MQTMWASSGNVTILVGANLKYPGSTTSYFPAAGNVNLMTNNGTEATLGVGFDAFGVATTIFSRYDCMDPVGATPSYDFGVF
jgi:hypothetical protein